ALVELGLVLEARDRLRDAARCHRQALQILGFDRSGDPDIARLTVRARTALAGIDRTLGAYAAADRGYRTAFAEIRRRFGLRDRYIAGVLNDLGVLRKAQGRYAEALAFYRRALPLVSRNDRHALATLAHKERVLGRHHADVAMTVNNLAVLERDQGNLERSAALFKRALGSFVKSVGARHPHTVLALANHRAVEREIAALAAQAERPAR